MITIDDREVTQHPDIPELLKLPVVVTRMEAADFAFLDSHNEPLGIERCEIGNLVQKLRSGELEDQLTRCEQTYKTIILLTEGVYDSVQGLLAILGESNRGYYRRHVFPHTTYDYVIASLIRLSDMGIETIHSPNFACSMGIVRIIYNQRTKPEEEHTLFKRIRQIKLPTKLSANPAVPKLMALAGRMPEKVAIRLIHKYDSIWNILHTEDRELLEIEGMGKGLLGKLKQGVGKDC